METKEYYYLAKIPMKPTSRNISKITDESAHHLDHSSSNDTNDDHALLRSSDSFVDTEEGSSSFSMDDFPNYLLCLIPKGISKEFISEAWDYYKGDKEQLIFCCRDISMDSDKVTMMNNPSLWKNLLKDSPLLSMDKGLYKNDKVSKTIIGASTSKPTTDQSYALNIDKEYQSLSSNLQPYLKTLIEFLGGPSEVHHFNDWFVSLHGALAPCLLDLSGLEAIISIYLDVNDEDIASGISEDVLLSLDVFIVDGNRGDWENSYSSMAHRRSLLGIVSKETCSHLNKNYSDVFNDLKRIASELGIDTTKYSYDTALMLYEAYSVRHSQALDVYTNPFGDLDVDVPKFPESVPVCTSYNQDMFNLSIMEDQGDEPLLQWRGGSAWPPVLSNGKMFPPRSISVVPACKYKHRVLKCPDFDAVRSNFALIQACKGNKVNAPIEASAKKIIAEEFAKVLRTSLDNSAGINIGILPPSTRWETHAKGHKHCVSLSIDLHYCAREVCRSVILGWIDFLRCDNNQIFQIHFVTGLGRGSRRSIPVLIITVLQEINRLCRSDRDLEWGWNKDHPGVILLQNRRKRIHVSQLDNSSKLPKLKRRKNKK